MGTRDQVSQWRTARRLAVASVGLMLFVPIMAMGLGVGQSGAATGSLTGTVYESNGTPAANTQVSAGGPAPCCQSTNTDSSGAYVFAPALADGTWNVTANPPMGDSTDASTSVSVTVASGVVTAVNGNPATGPVNITLQVPVYLSLIHI